METKKGLYPTSIEEFNKEIADDPSLLEPFYEVTKKALKHTATELKQISGVSASKWDFGQLLYIGAIVENEFFSELPLFHAGRAIIDNNPEFRRALGCIHGRQLYWQDLLLAEELEKVNAPHPAFGFFSNFRDILEPNPNFSPQTVEKEDRDENQAQSAGVDHGGSRGGNIDNFENGAEDAVSGDPKDAEYYDESKDIEHADSGYVEPDSSFIGDESFVSTVSNDDKAAVGRVKDELITTRAAEMLIKLILGISITAIVKSTK